MMMAMRNNFGECAAYCAINDHCEIIWSSSTIWPPSSRKFTAKEKLYNLLMDWESLLWERSAMGIFKSVSV